MYYLGNEQFEEYTFSKADYLPFCLDETIFLQNKLLPAKTGMILNTISLPILFHLDL